jgi:hypothetical protein
MATKEGKKTGGRKKGTPNKIAGAVREALFDAFENAGGVDYLTNLATEDPRVFCTLLGKVLPSNVSVAGEEGGPLEIKATIKYV